MDTPFTGSRFSQYLMQKAESVQKENGKKILSAEILFYVALCYYKDGQYASDFAADENDRKEMEAVRTLMQTYLSGTENADFSDVFSRNESYMDNYLFMQYIASANEKAKQNGKEEVPFDVLLSCILEKPTAEISKMLRPQKKEGSEKTKSEEPIPVREEIRDEKSEEQPKAEPEPVDAKEQIAALTQKVKDMQKSLRQQVIGQDNAISVFASGYFQAEMKRYTQKKQKGPKATFLFAGPPGVGKTFLAEKVSEELGLAYMRFDMSEYADPDAVMELCGTNPAFKGDREGAATGFVRKNPNCILLFDEIEKAHINAIHLFLQILDAGRLRDANLDKEIDFSNTIIIFTTNAGRKLYEDSPTQNLSSISRKTILKALETDVDPKTQKSAFPAAICSRFATGNVVMFNHMRPDDLQTILKNEIGENVRSMQNEAQISCSVAEDVCSCILFAEGGLADARTVRSRASSFLSTELYELYRLLANQKCPHRVEDIKTISFELDLPTDDEQISRLFRNDTELSMLAFCSDERMASALRAANPNGSVFVTDSVEQAKKILSAEDVDLVLCDLFTGIAQTRNYINAEDIDSDGRTFLKHVCSSLEMPVYVLCSAEKRFTEEEQFSLLKQGVRGTVDVTARESLPAQIREIASRVYCQKSINSLARANKVLTYGSTQSISEDGNTAKVLLYDLALETAVDADDADVFDRVYMPDVRLDDVIGAADAKNELTFFMDYLKNPKSFIARGCQPPKGVLFYGPPGTGKTMLAKAVAGECGVVFISAEGNQFRKKYVGEGEETVHRLFSIARKYAPAIVFIDEIDAIALERTGDHIGSESALTALLTEMDGFNTDTSRPVFVLAATNYHVEGTSRSLDAALLRRFDRRILIDLPSKEDRIRFLRIHAKKRSFDLTETEIENIAVRSTGMSLADLTNVFSFAQRIASRQNKDIVDDDAFEEAFETFNFGEEKQWSAREIERTARHEAGHALLCWYFGETPSYLTIVARGDHGGYMLNGDTEKHGSYAKQELLSRICVSLGGRAAELVYYGDEGGLTTGASSDLQTATQIARSIVCSFGMDEGMGLASISSEELLRGEIAADVHRSVNTILLQEMQKAKDIIGRNREAIDQIVAALLQKNHLSGNEIDQILSERVVRI